jgi:XTP/dITP diphosphohydrolase
VEENGSTYEENALLKAKAWADFIGFPALADDSGIEVRCLGWKPGILSARAASSDTDRIKRLLGLMSGSSDRRARFVASLAVAFPGESIGRGYFSSDGVCWGFVVDSPSGTSGFGYDPIFVPDGREETFADLGPDVKSKISHRALAFEGLARMLPSVIQYWSLRLGFLESESPMGVC